MSTTPSYRAGTYAATRHAGARHFLRSYVEMLLAMYAGMLGLGAVFALILVAAGTTANDARYDLPVLFGLVMAFNMTVGMAAWMRYRGHSRDRILEMSLAMVVPAAAAVVLFWCGVLHAGGICPLECMAMIPAMLVAMLFHAHEYSESAQSQT